MLNLLDWLVFLREQRRHIRVVTRIVARIVTRTAGRFRLLLFLLQLVGIDVQLLNRIVVGIIPPLLLPAPGIVGGLLAQAEVVVAATDLQALGAAVVVLAQTGALLPAHAHHQFLGVLALELYVGDSGTLEEAVAVFAGHQQ